MGKLLWIGAGAVAMIVVRTIVARRTEGDLSAAALPPHSAADRIVEPALSEAAGQTQAAAAVVPTAMAAGMIALFSRVSHGNTLRFTFVPAAAVSWALLMRVLRHRRRDFSRLITWYFVALAWQFVHFVEENATGFRYRWPVEIFHTEPYGPQQFVAINLLSYAAFVLGGLALMHGRPELAMPAVFFIVMGVMGNGLQHPLYSWIVRGYFPGLWTSLPNLVVGPLLLQRLAGRA